MVRHFNLSHKLPLQNGSLLGNEQSRFAAGCTMDLGATPTSFLRWPNDCQATAGYPAKFSVSYHTDASQSYQRTESKLIRTGQLS